jgi:hypothetical protein
MVRATVQYKNWHFNSKFKYSLDACLQFLVQGSEINLKNRVYFCYGPVQNNVVKVLQGKYIFFSHNE